MTSRTFIFAVVFAVWAPIAAPADELVAVRIETDPAGATIYVDGMPRGETPASLALPTGEHELFLYNPGYFPAKRRVTWNVGDRPSFRETLRTQHGGLVVIADPPGATVYFDERMLGMAPLAFENLPTGDHEVAVRRAGFEPFTATLQIGSEEPRVVTARLQGAPVGLFIEAEPGTRVFLDGSFAGEVTSESLSLRVRAGVHELRIEKGGFASVRRLTLEPDRDAFVGVGEMARIPGLMGREQAAKVNQRWYLVGAAGVVALGGAVVGVTSALSGQAARDDYEKAFRRADIAAAKDRIRLQNWLTLAGAGVAALGAGGVVWAWPRSRDAEVSAGPQGVSLAWRF